MDSKKLSTCIFMVSSAAMVVWGVIANDWSKCWLCPLIGGVIGVIVRVLGDRE